MNLQQLPKVELHLHLEGAAPPAFIRRLGQEKDVNLSGVFSEDGNYIFNDFVDFLRVYEASTFGSLVFLVDFFADFLGFFSASSGSIIPASPKANITSSSGWWGLSTILAILFLPDFLK